MLIDLPRGVNAAIASFSETMFKMSTELDKGFPLSSRDVRVEDKNEKFDFIKAKLASTLRSQNLLEPFL